MIEIGSEFWDVPTCEINNGLFTETIQWFLSGRSALNAIVGELTGCHTVALPSWCCDSMVKPFLNAGMEVRFYSVLFDHRLSQQVNLTSDALLLMDYFGYSTCNPDLSSCKSVIIRDVTQSAFSASYSDADYYFGSLRKWCGVWTGGYVWTQDGHSLQIDQGNDFGFTIFREKAMQLKNSYIHGEEVNDKNYLSVFDKAEESLEKVFVAPAAERDVFLAQRLDVTFIQRQRRSNAKVLMDAFSDYLMFSELKDSDCPMFVPILVPDGKRDALRRYLIQHDIYCPVHWPVSKYHKLGERELNLYKNELSLVCDQRYTEEDMYRMVDTIEMFWKEG